MAPSRLVAVFGFALATLLASTSPAQAGRVVATGHPFDIACATRPAAAPSDGCRALRTIVNWSRAGTPDPTKPLLLMQRNDGPLQSALTAAYPEGAPPSLQVVDPSASYVAQMPIETSAYSAVVVASDRPDGSGVSVPEAVRAKLRAFFEAGGGVVLLAGSPGVLLPVGSRPGAPGGRPYVRTDDGRELGLTEADTDCCNLLRGFDEPVGALLVAERDGAGAPATVFGSGLFQGRRLTSPIMLPSGADDDPEGDPSAPASSCRSRRRFRIQVKRLPGLRYRRVSVKVGGRKPMVLTGGRIRSVVDLRGLPKGRYRVRITVTTLDGQTFTGARRYITCEPRKLPGRKNRL